MRSWEAENSERSASIKRNQEYPDPTSILEAIRAETKDEAIIVTDVGQHQMWTARHYTWTRPNSHITSGGLGTMGFALPAAMGVKMGIPDATVWVVAGDGGIQMNIQELATLEAGRYHGKSSDHEQWLSGNGAPVAAFLPQR